MAKPRLGWIGTGVIGGACARRALDAGYELVVTSRTKSKATPLLDAGARWEETPRLVAENADVVFSTVGTPKDVREIFFGDEGVLAAWRNYSSPSAPKTYVDSTTSSPELAQEIARATRRLCRFWNQRASRRRAGRRSAYEDGESDSYRGQYDRGLRVFALRLSRGP